MSFTAQASRLKGFAETAAAQSEDLEKAAAALNKVASEKWGDPVWRAEQAAEIVRMIDEQFRADNTLAQFFNVTQVGEFDNVVKRKRSGIQAFWTHRGGYIHESQFAETEVEVPRDSVGFHVSEFDHKVRAGYAQWVAALMESGRIAIENEITRRMVNLLAAASPAGGANHVAVGAPVVTKAALDAAIDAVADAPVVGKTNADRQISIIGRRTALGGILDFQGFASEAQEEIRKRGMLGVYRGAQIGAFVNQLDETGAPFISDKEIFVVAKGVGEVVKYGTLRGNTWSENTATYLHSQARAEVGVIVDEPTLLRRLTLS